MKIFTILGSDVVCGVGYVCMVAVSTCEISVSPSQFCCKPKTPLEK